MWVLSKNIGRNRNSVPSGFRGGPIPHLFIYFSCSLFLMAFALDNKEQLVQTLLLKEDEESHNRFTHSNHISWNQLLFPVDFELRVGVDYFCAAYEPKVNKSNLPEMLLNYLSYLAQEESKKKDQQESCIPLRILCYREGQENSLVDEKQPADEKDKPKRSNYFGDLITVLAPGTYLATHRDKKLLIHLESEGYRLMKECFFLQLHWFRNSSHTFQDKETISCLLNDAKEYQSRDESHSQLLNVYRFSASTLWEQLPKRIPQRDLATIHLPDAQKQSIVSEIQRFFEQQEELKKKNLPRKLVYLFSAPRGGGKTELIHALLTHFKLHKGILSPDEIDSDLLCVSALPNRTAICLENVDEIDDESILERLELLLEGRECEHPILVFLTSRTQESSLSEMIRKSLLTGRIDHTEAFKPPQRKQMEEMFFRFFPEQNKQDFSCFWEKVRKMHLPNLCLLENFFRKRLHLTNIWNSEEMETLHDMIIEHKKNSSNAGQQMVI